MAKRMKSDQARVQWRDVLDDVQAGETILVERYNRAVAQVIPADDTIVVLRVRDANQAERLRRIAREHGSLGIPFPNNTTAGWRVVDANGDPVNTHAIPSVAVTIPTEETTVISNVLADQIRTTLGDHPDDFDIEAIVSEIGDTYGRDNIRTVDDVPSDEYWTIVRKHERSA